MGCLLAQSGGVVAQMVERSLSIRKVRGLIAHIFADHTVYGHFHVVSGNFLAVFSQFSCNISASFTPYISILHWHCVTIKAPI